MKKRVGIYVRVSTFDQKKGLLSQKEALKDYCINHNLTGRKWYRDRVSGATTDRPAFKKLQADIFAGKINTVIVWKLDRLSRSLKDGINIIINWTDKGVRIISVSQQIDFNGTTGKLIASVLLAVAQMERENISENVKRGMVAAKANGVKLGKRPKLFSKDIIPLLQDNMSISDVAENLGVSRPAIYNCLKRENIELDRVRA